MKNIIQKVSALALMTLAVINANAQNPAVTLSEVNIAPGEEKTVSIFLANNPDDQIVQFEGVVTLPAGFEFVKTGNAYATKGERATDDQTAIARTVETNGDVQSCKMGLLTLASQNPYGPDNTKSILDFTIKAPDNFPAVTNITISNIVISVVGKSAYRGTKANPYNATPGIVNNTTAPLPKFAFAGGDTLRVHKGDTATVTLNATWPSSINVKATSGTITLPDGLSFVKDGENVFTFNAGRFSADPKGQNLKDGVETWLVYSVLDVLAATPEELGSFKIAVDPSFEGNKTIAATYEFTDADAKSVGRGTINLTVGVIPDAPTFAIAPDTLKLSEGETDTLAIAINVPEGTKPTVKGSVTLPEGLTFAEGDGTFNLEALEDNDTVKVAVIAGKAFEGAKDIDVAINATSEEGDAYDPFAGKVAVTIAAPQAPEFAFAEADSIALEEGAEATIVVNLTIPEGTELSSIAGTVTLPTGVSFSTQAPGIQLENGTVNTNGNTATWTATPTEAGALLTINIHTNQGFKDGVVKVEATATSKAGTTFDKVTIERKIGNKTAAGISDIKAVTEKTVDGPAYNLNGQRVSKNYKGIVIVNGKKYIAK